MQRLVEDCPPRYNPQRVHCVGMDVLTLLIYSMKSKKKKISIYGNIEQMKKKKGCVHTGLCEMEMREGTEGKLAATLESSCNISERE